MRQHDAWKVSVGLVPETCPKVDAAFEEAVEKVKAQTNALRDALVSVIQEKAEIEDQLEEAQAEIRSLKEEVSDLKHSLSRFE